MPIHNIFEYDPNLMTYSSTNITLDNVNVALKFLGIDGKPDDIFTQNGLPKVERVDIYNHRVVKVTFCDGTFTKSVCSENDHFDLDVGITICLFKRRLGNGPDDCTKIYNKLIKSVHDIMDRNEKEIELKRAYDEEQKRKQRKLDIAKAVKRMKVKEEQIDIVTQGTIRAMQQMNSKEDKNEA